MKFKFFWLGLLSVCLLVLGVTGFKSLGPDPEFATKMATEMQKHPNEIQYSIDLLGPGTIFVTGKYFNTWNGHYYFDSLKAGLEDASKRYSLRNCISVNFSAGYVSPTSGFVCFYDINGKK